MTPKTAEELLEFIETCLDSKTADELMDFVANNAEDLIDKARTELS